MEGEIQRARKDAEDKINALAPNQLSLYRELLEQNNQISMELQEGQRGLNQISNELGHDSRLLWLLLLLQAANRGTD
jgi:hypothetical protein